MPSTKREEERRAGRQLGQMLMPLLEPGVENAVARAARPKTEQELITEQILGALDELGGQNIGEDAIVFTGSQIVLPEDMKGKLDKVREFLEEYEEAQETRFSFSRTLNYRPYDVAAAFDRAMKRVFGVGGIGRAQFSFFGVTPPEYITVNSGPKGQTLQVPWERVEFSLLEADFMLSEDKSAEYGRVGKITVTAPKKNRMRVEGFFKVVEQELRERSIYRGTAITAHPTEPQFIDLDAVDPARVIYTRAVEEQLEVNLWAPLRYTAALRATGVPLKRAVLLFGPNGTGKTLAGGLAGRLATENGWTYILVRSQDDPLEALNTARMYSPAVVMIEDLDTMASSDQDRDQVTAVLDRLDNVEAKGAEVMVIFTSNYADKLDRNVVRPGRLDAVIQVAALDAPGYERLVRALVPAELLAPDVDYGQVTAALDGFLPAFATEAVLRAMRYSIARNAGVPGVITTADLVAAAHGMADHIALMDAATHATSARPTLDTALADVVARTVEQARGRFVPAEEGGDIHSILENAAVSFADGNHSG